MVALKASVTSAVDPWAVQSRVGLTDARLALNSMLMPRPNMTYIDYRSGIMASGDTGGVGGSGHMAMKVSPASGMACTVEMGNAVLNTPNQGAYMCALDSKKTLTLSASSSTTNRIDLIVARVYDDLNSALASGARKFTVEVWEGDPATGEPTRPTPTPASGWHPLAAIYVGKGVSTITTANVTDLRGPGLVARGGMRALYGADTARTSAAFNEPGAYPGDQRWVHTAGFQHQVYYGSNGNALQSGWRGVHNSLYYEKSAPAGGAIYNTGSHGEIMRVTVPAIGVPFRLKPTATITLDMGYYVDAEVRLSVDSKTGGLINWSMGSSKGFIGEGTHGDRIVNVPAYPWGIYDGSGSVDVVLSVSIRDAIPGRGYGVTWTSSGLNKMCVEVNPAPAHPPAN